MKKIKLTQGKFAKVDDVYFPHVNVWKWYYLHGYAVRKIKNGKKRRTIFMHRVISQVTSSFEVDHINGDRLDNRTSNLRVCTRKQNCQNRRSLKNSSSKYLGVTWNKRAKKWQAQIKGKYLGIFRNETDAAKAYDKIARQFYGEYANLNFKGDT